MEYLNDISLIAPCGMNCAICSGYLEGKVDFCFECNCYPCDRLKHLDERYQREFGMSMIENLMEVKEKGIHEFMKNQYKKYKCPRCNGLISIHNKKCFVCDKINSWRD